MHVGASLMYVIGRAPGFRAPRHASHFLLAGGAAGIAAAFNTPLAGVVFAIEELSGRFEHRFSGALLTAVIVGGVVSLGLLGTCTYFGRVEVGLPLGMGWLAVLAERLVAAMPAPEAPAAPAAVRTGWGGRPFRRPGDTLAFAFGPALQQCTAEWRHSRKWRNW